MKKERASLVVRFTNEEGNGIVGVEILDEETFEPSIDVVEGLNEKGLELMLEASGAIAELGAMIALERLIADIMGE